MNLQQKAVKTRGSFGSAANCYPHTPCGLGIVEGAKVLNFDHHHCKVESLLAKCKEEVRIWCLAAKSVGVRITRLVSFVLDRGFLLSSFF